MRLPCSLCWGRNGSCSSNRTLRWLHWSSNNSCDMRRPLLCVVDVWNLLRLVPPRTPEEISPQGKKKQNPTSDHSLWSLNLTIVIAECAVWSLHGSLLLALVCLVSRTQGDEESSLWCRCFVFNHYGSSSSSSDEHRREQRRFIFFIIISIICQKPTQWSRDGPSIENIPYKLCCLCSLSCLRFYVEKFSYQLILLVLQMQVCPKNKFISTFFLHFT